MSELCCSKSWELDLYQVDYRLICIFKAGPFSLMLLDFINLLVEGRVTEVHSRAQSHESFSNGLCNLRSRLLLL